MAGGPDEAASGSPTARRERLLFVTLFAHADRHTDRDRARPVVRVTILVFSNDSLASLALKLFETSQHFTLLGDPVLHPVGRLHDHGRRREPDDPLRVACIGHLRGGLAMAGRAGVHAVRRSFRIVARDRGGHRPDRHRRHDQGGLPQGVRGRVICNAGTLGILIPPSIVMVVYGAATETSVGQLFMAGVIPGIVLGLMLMTAIYVAARWSNCRASRAPAESMVRGSPGPRVASGALLLLVSILGGIYGLDGPSRPEPARPSGAERSYACTDRGVRLPRHRHQEVPHVLVEPAKVTVMLMFIIANALLFAHVLTTERIPHRSPR